jgi:hypothetical protein
MLTKLQLEGKTFMLRSDSIADFTHSARIRAGFACAIAATLVLAGSASGQDGTAGFDITHSTQSGGGGTSSGGDFSLDGSIGEVVAGTMAGGEFNIVSGSLPPEAPTCERADLNCDGIINGADLGVMLLHWGPCPGSGAGSCQGDINSDGIIDGSDLGGLLVHWG